LKNGVWCSVDLIVVVRNDYSNDKLFGLEGTIRTVNKEVIIAKKSPQNKII
jgi:hypothetical protein